MKHIYTCTKKGCKNYKADIVLAMSPGEITRATGGKATCKRCGQILFYRRAE